MPPWVEEFRKRDGENPAVPLVVTMATCDAGGSPRARSVVVRRIGDEGALWIASDARSDKNLQLDRRPEAEVVCWLPAAREQWRLWGPVDRLTAAHRGEERQTIWRQLSDSSRALFFWPDPGEPLSKDAKAFPQAVNASVFPPMSFELLVVNPERVECLQVGSHPHRRRRWELEQDWQFHDLNP